MVNKTSIKIGNFYKTKFQIILAPLLLMLFFVLDFQGQSNLSNNDCRCLDSFNQVISKIETNYVGYHIEVKGKRQFEYKRVVEKLRRKSQSVISKNCIFVLQEYLRFFRDGHLFISENPILSEEEVKELTEKAERLPFNESEVRKYLDKNASNLDPIEGIWYESEGYRVGIIRDVKRGRREFAAIMLSENIKNWSTGQIKAEFSKLPDGSYNVTFYNGRHYPLNLSIYQRGEKGGASIRRGVLLHMPPITWGKEYPSNSSEEKQIDSINPRAPLVYFPDQSTVVFSIPSHSPEFAEKLKGLIKKHASRILQSKNLIIDIRGDEGGSAWMTDPLMPFLITDEKRKNKIIPDSQSFVLSSQDNIKHFQRIESEGWIPKNLIPRMSSNIGKVIPFKTDSNKDSVSVSAQIKQTNFPKDVAILQDSGVVSAGEAFVLEAMRNKKITLFGENTGGVIDYQNVSVIQIAGCPSLEFYLGYPMIATSDRLPQNGINSIGIRPDVQIPKGVKNPLKFIIDYYKAN